MSPSIGVMVMKSSRSASRSEFGTGSGVGDRPRPTVEKQNSPALSTSAQDGNALLAAVHGHDAHDEAQRLARSDWEIDALPLREAITTLIDYQLDRHRRLLSCYGRFHREQHRATSLAHALGPRAVEAHIRSLLERASGELRAGNLDLDHAAFFLTRGLSAIVRSAVEERPEKLGQESFRLELIALATRYLFLEPAESD